MLPTDNPEDSVARASYHPNRDLISAGFVDFGILSGKLMKCFGELNFLGPVRGTRLYYKSRGESDVEAITVYFKEHPHGCEKVEFYHIGI